VPEIRQDPTTREWVIIATERAKRPHEFASLPHRSGQASRSSCVFCPGNEKLVREGARWYQGTAEAVRQNLRNFLESPYEYYLVLSGDHLYRMDYGDLLHEHVRTGADITLGTTPVDRRAASGCGILQSDAERHIFRFEERPKDPKLLDGLRISPNLLKELGRPADTELYQASMGIYVFNRQVLIDVSANDHDDFGKHIIPASLQKYQVFAYIFQGYWENIGTVRAFFEANLALTDPVPAFDFFDNINQIYSRQLLLPSRTELRSEISHS
jgi:glucose-1-phosphate adenylyltransferase